MNYKRIIRIDPAKRNELMTHAVCGVKIRGVRDRVADEYVIETDDKNEIRAVNKIVQLFNID